MCSSKENNVEDEANENDQGASSSSASQAKKVKKTMYEVQSSTCTVTNQTPYRIGIKQAHKDKTSKTKKDNEKETFARVIAPFGNIKYSVDQFVPRQVEISEEDEAVQSHPEYLTKEQVKVRESQKKDLDLEDWKNWNLIKVKPQEQADRSILEMSFGSIFIVFFYGALIWGIWELFGEPAPHYWTIIIVVSLLSPFVVLCYKIIKEKGKTQKVKKRFRNLWIGILHSANMAATILVAFGLPALFIILAGDVRSKSDHPIPLSYVPNQTVSIQTTVVPQASDAVAEEGVSWLEWLRRGVSTSIERFKKTWHSFKGELAKGASRFEYNIHTLGRFLQFLFIGIFSSLPAFLFYLFNRQRLSTIREDFFRSMLVLDPSLMNLSDTKSIYGQRVDEIYGRVPEEFDAPKSSGRLLKAKRTIILITTLIITIGWILFLSPVGKAPVQVDLCDYFIPRPIPILFAFLGSYVFAMGLLFRLYIRSDLKPKAYAQVSVRIITSIAIVWTLSMLSMSSKPSTPFLSNLQLPSKTESLASISEQIAKETPPARFHVSQTDSAAKHTGRFRKEKAETAQATAGKYKDTLLVMAFIIGFLPLTGFNILLEYLRNITFLKKRIPSLEERLPLNLLDGINIYHRARLLQEGIENLENLAHTDLVDLMLQTRVPLPTLIDWVDQAILYLHLRRTPLECEKENSQTDKNQGQNGKTDHSRTQLLADIKALRTYGIRTATDLKEAYGQVKNRPVEEARQMQAQQDQKDLSQAYAQAKQDENEFLSILDQEVQENKPKRLQIILYAIADDEWMPHLEHYRNIERFSPKIRTFEFFESRFCASSETTE